MFVPDDEPRQSEVDAMTNSPARAARRYRSARAVERSAIERRRPAPGGGFAHIAGEAGVTAVFTSTFTRTIQTVGPLVARLGQIAHPVPAPAVLAQQVTAGALGSVVVIAGHSNTIPEMIEALGVPAAPVIGELEFDNLFVVSVVGGEAALLRLKYGESRSELPIGDCRRRRISTVLRDFDAPPVDRMGQGANLHPGEDHMPLCRMSSRAGYFAPGRGYGFGRSGSQVSRGIWARLARAKPRSLSAASWSILYSNRRTATCKSSLACECASPRLYSRHTPGTVTFADLLGSCRASYLALVGEEQPDDDVDSERISRAPAAAGPVAPLSAVDQFTDVNPGVITYRGII